VPNPQFCPGALLYPFQSFTLLQSLSTPTSVILSEAIYVLLRIVILSEAIYVRLEFVIPSEAKDLLYFFNCRHQRVESLP
jgi:hypothetical protein